MFPSWWSDWYALHRVRPRAGPRLPLAVDNQRKSDNTWTSHPVIADDPQHERTTVLVTGQLGRAHVYKIDWTGFSSA